MNPADQARSVDLRSGHPGVLLGTKTPPANQVLEATADHPGIKKGLDIILFLTIHQQGRRWRRRGITRSIPRGTRFKKGDVENRVDAKMGRKSQTDGGQIDHRLHFVRTNKEGAQLATGGRQFQMPSGEPHQIPDSVGWRRPAPAVIGAFVALPGLLQVARS